MKIGLDELRAQEDAREASLATKILGIFGWSERGWFRGLSESKLDLSESTHITEAREEAKRKFDLLEDEEENVFAFDVASARR